MPRGIPNAKPDETEPIEDEVSAPVETEPANESLEEIEAVEVETDDAPDEEDAASERRETFEATRPDGTVVVVDRNIDTGEQTVTEK